MFDWNDLRYFAAVAEHGSTLAAAKALGVNQSTVQRRLAELQQRLGRPLVERQATGYRLTEFGQSLLPAVRQVAASVSQVQQQVESSQRDVTGVLRVTCPEPVVSRIQRSGLIERFHARYPRLRVEFVMSDKYLDLAAGDADVAFRSGDTDDNALVGRKIADSLWGVYASRDYVARHGRPQALEALNDHAVIGFDESMARHRAAIWLAQVAPRARVAARANSVLGVLYSAKAGVGMAALPTALADAEPELEKLLGPVPELTRSWRLLTTQPLRKSPRVAAFFEFVVAEIDALREVFTGG